MELQRKSDLSKKPACDALIFPFWQGKKRGEPAVLVKGLESLFEFPVDEGDFHAREGETLLLYGKKEKRVILVGLGPVEVLNDETIRRAYGEALKLCRRMKLRHVAVLFPEIENPVVLPALEGMLLANYEFGVFKTFKEDKQQPPIAKAQLIGVDQPLFEKCKSLQILIESVNFTRDLVNGNADEVTPQMLAKTAHQLEKVSKRIKVNTVSKEELKKRGLGLLLAVAQGSCRDPVLVVIEYKGDPNNTNTTAIIGKGVTYDTGGLNLKPTGSMETMKSDMSGAAAVLGTLKAAAELGLKCNLLGVVVATENAIGPESYKPGDVYKSYSGITVEIANTDAEGRLILGDAMSYIQDQYNPSRVITLATLTGGIVVALGEEATGLFSNDDGFAQALIQSGERSFERLWRMPLYKEYKETLKSSIADIKNSGDRKASSPVAAIFLQYFIREDVVWAHLDIAGTAFLTTPRHYHMTHATGVGVRLLIDFLRHEQEDSESLKT